MTEPFKTERIHRKADLANWLGWQHRFNRYLEIASLTTGHQFALISPTVFSTIHRAMYRLPPDHHDGLPTTCRTESDDSRECLAALPKNPGRYDLIFVDPFHTYECSRRDLEQALALLAPGGILLVHDCHPTTPEQATPEFRPGEWLGLTYLAFLDLMRENPEFEYCVVDVDYGCGVVRRRPPGTQAPPMNRLLESGAYRTWPAYFENRVELLNLVGIEAFLADRRLRSPALVAIAVRAALRIRHGLRNWLPPQA